jgi:hypothetical protein
MTERRQVIDADTAKKIAEDAAHIAVERYRTCPPALAGCLPTACHDKFEALLREQESAQKWREAQEERLIKIDAALAENTSVTKTIQSAVTAGRVFTMVIRWVGVIAAAAGAIWGVIYMAMHGGQPPGGGPIGPIGPTP